MNRSTSPVALLSRSETPTFDDAPSPRGRPAWLTFLRRLQAVMIIANITVAAITTSQIDWHPLLQCWIDDDGNQQCGINGYTSSDSNGFAVLALGGLSIVSLGVASLVPDNWPSQRYANLDGYLMLLWVIGTIAIPADPSNNGALPLKYTTLGLSASLALLSLAHLVYLSVKFPSLKRDRATGKQDEETLSMASTLSPQQEPSVA